jgi:hypothetical protein
MLWDGIQCQNGYTLPVVAAPIHLLHAKEFDSAPRSFEEHSLPDLGWGRFGLELASIVMVEGNHSSIYTQPETLGHIDTIRVRSIGLLGALDVGKEAADRSEELQLAAAMSAKQDDGQQHR